VDDLDVDALYHFVEFARDLTDPERAVLLSRAAWPEAVVRRDGVVRGFLMARVPPPYYTDLRFGEDTTTELAAAQYLLNPRAYLEDRGLPTDDAFRLRFLRDTALTLALFHNLDIAVGDLSPNNLLFSADQEPHCYFLDCDAMRLRGESVLVQAETPDWQVPEQEKATPASDSYKLGLLAVRLFAADQQARDPKALPVRLRRQAQACLAEDPARREPPTAWVGPLNRQLRSTPAGRSSGPAAARRPSPPRAEQAAEPKPPVVMIPLAPSARQRRRSTVGGWMIAVGVAVGLFFGILGGGNSPARPPLGSQVTFPPYTAGLPAYPGLPTGAVPTNVLPTVPVPSLPFPSYRLPIPSVDLLCVLDMVKAAPGVRGGAGLRAATKAVNDYACDVLQGDRTLPGVRHPVGGTIVGFFGEGTASPRAVVDLGVCVTVRFTRDYRISSVSRSSGCG
jgi:hypothetical protein